MSGALRDAALAVSAAYWNRVLSVIEVIALDAALKQPSTSSSDDAAETSRNGLGAVTAADTLAEEGTNSLVEFWAVVASNGTLLQLHHNEAAAKSSHAKPGARIVRMREVTE